MSGVTKDYESGGFGYPSFQGCATHQWCLDRLVNEADDRRESVVACQPTNPGLMRMDGPLAVHPSLQILSSYLPECPLLNRRALDRPCLGVREPC